MAAAAYARIAQRYDSLHHRWLRYAGGGAQAAFEAAVMMAVRPGAQVLDAGCGTGALARRLLAQCPGAQATLLDACPDMLAQAADVRARRVEGSLLDLPFADAGFDLVTAAWSIETTDCPARALRELQRVLRPGGDLVLVFCSDAAPELPLARLLRLAVQMRSTGRFLRADAVEALLRRNAAGRTLRLPSLGPATAMLFRKAAAAPVAAPRTGPRHPPARAAISQAIHQTGDRP